MEWLIILLAYTLCWGSFQFWGIVKTKRKIIANPEKYPMWMRKLFVNMPLYQQIILGIAIGVGIPAFLIIVPWLVSLPFR